LHHGDPAGPRRRRVLTNRRRGRALLGLEAALVMEFEAAEHEQRHKREEGDRDEVLRAELVAGLGERGDVRDHREAEQRDELDLLEQKNFKRGSQRVTEDQMRRERSSLKVTCWSILFT
jgi:hypothetical protein